MRTILAAVLVLTACGVPEDTKHEAAVKQATQDTEQALEGASAARRVLEVFGVIPNYSCGPLTNSIGKALPPVSVGFACGAMVTGATGVDFTFPEEGCDVGGHRVKGALKLELGVGEDRIDVSADFRSLRIDGQTLPVRVGMGVCGDEKRVWATVEHPALRLDAMLGYRKGLPIIGHTDITLDGTGSMEATSVAAEGLEYELGAMLPKAGRLTFDRADGTHVSVKFTEVLWKLGKAEITVGDAAPVEVPIAN